MSVQPESAGDFARMLAETASQATGGFALVMLVPPAREGKHLVGVGISSEDTGWSQERATELASRVNAVLWAWMREDERDA